MNAQFTKTPWEIVEPTQGRPSRIGVSGANGQCDIYDAPLTTETLANAKLIAAAPQLLEACRVMAARLQMLDDKDVSFHFEGVGYRPQWFAESIIHKAIA